MHRGCEEVGRTFTPWREEVPRHEVGGLGTEITVRYRRGMLAVTPLALPGEAAVSSALGQPRNIRHTWIRAE